MRAAPPSAATIFAGTITLRRMPIFAIRALKVRGGAGMGGSFSFLAIVLVRQEFSGERKNNGSKERERPRKVDSTSVRRDPKVSTSRLAWRNLPSALRR